jgi:hypothetical protein
VNKLKRFFSIFILKRLPVYILAGFELTTLSSSLLGETETLAAQLPDDIFKPKIPLWVNNVEAV